MRGIAIGLLLNAASGTGAAMKRHARVPLCLMAALTAYALVSPANAACIESGGPGTIIETDIGNGLAATSVLLRLLRGGTAEYIAGGTCTLLSFTAIRDGSAVYTDDGLGRGLSVAVAPDRTLTVSHASGWTAKSR